MLRDVEAVSHLDHVSINAKDLPATGDFYAHVFGAEPLKAAPPPASFRVTRRVTRGSPSVTKPGLE